MRTALAVLLLMILPAGVARGQTPEEALRDIVTSTDFNTLREHLPLNVHQALADAPKTVIAGLMQRYAQRRSEISSRAQVDAGYGETLAVVKSKSSVSEEFSIRIARSVNDGAQAFFRLEICRPKSCRSTGEIWMHYEDHSWRITDATLYEAGVAYNADGLAHFLRQPPYLASELSAIGSVRTVNTANVTYASTYELGFASSLDELGGNDQQCCSSQHATLISDDLAHGAKDGYTFTYERESESEYRVIARPTRYGQTGNRSFFSDESGVIRSTEEDREPAADDDPLQ